MAGNANSGRRPGYKHAENTRQKIKATQIINRMQQDFFASIDVDGKAKRGQRRPLTAIQVRIGEVLLRKVLPDLQTTTLAGDEENPLRLVPTVVYETPSTKK